MCSGDWEESKMFNIVTYRLVYLVLVALFLGASFGHSPGGATSPSNYPTRPVKVIVPLAAGSTVDVVARKLGEQLGAAMGQGFVIDNRPGAGGVIGTAELTRAPKDGYTIGMISSNHVINPGIIKTIPFHPLKDITPIAVVGTVPLALVVHPSLGVNNVSELIELAKKNPDTLNYGSAGNGSVLHLAGVMFNKEAGVEIRHVPYRGTGPLTNDLVGGHVKIAFIAVTAVLPYIKRGDLKVLGVSTPTRVSILPDTPTLMEQGLKNYSFDAWVALIGPAGLPQPIVSRLYAETKKILETKKMQDDFATLGFTVIDLDPTASAEFLATELTKHQRLVAESGATAE
jgi:tripartite-type tricarboxylate transporter receptor subunit TctC